jgi:hypothetical protein
VKIIIIDKKHLEMKGDLTLYNTIQIKIGKMQVVVIRKEILIKILDQERQYFRTMTTL